MSADLLGQISKQQEVASFTCDGTYETQDLHKACYWRGAVPIIHYAKERICAKGLHSPTAMRGLMLPVAGARYLEIQERLSLKVSIVETKMNCFKRLGKKVMARTFKRQVAELNI